MSPIMKIVRRVNIALAVGATAGFMYYSDYHYKEFTAATELEMKNTPEAFKRRAKELFNKTVNDLQLTSEQKSMIDFYVSNNYNVRRLNYVYPEKKAFIGIPKYFLLDTIVDIEPENENENNPLTPEKKTQLKEYLSLSENAKKFAIAHEVKIATNAGILLAHSFPLLLFIQANIVSYFMEKFGSAKDRQPKNQGFAFIATLLIYIIFSDWISFYVETVTDRELIQLKDYFLQGGLEYYDKLLKRNKIIEKCTNGSSYITENAIGNLLGFRKRKVLSILKKRHLQAVEEAKKNNTEFSYLKFFLFSN